MTVLPLHQWGQGRSTMRASNASGINQVASSVGGSVSL